MNKKLLLISAAAAWIAFPALGAYMMVGQSPVAGQIRPKQTHEIFASTSAGSLGSLREKAVIEATRRYVAAHPDAPIAMREGRELAPVEVLNADLKKRQANFRVRTVKGTRALFFEVS